MREDSNEKTGGSGVETLEPRERAEAPDNRIAPSAPRGEEGASVGGASATAASAPSSRRPRKALLATGVVAAAVALCAVVASMGFATGWLGNPAPSDPVPMPSVVTDAPSDGDDASQGDEADRKDAAEEASEGTDGEAGAAVDGEGAADADGSAASTAGEAPSGTEPSASEGAAAPAPAPAPEPAPAPSAPSTVTVSVYIDSSRAASNGYPSSLGGGTVTLNQGASVYDALCATGASVGGSSGYVSSIGGLAEFACGPGSGWLYFVNGSSPGYGCGSYILSGGENITWIYTCDLGNDL